MIEEAYQSDEDHIVAVFFVRYRYRFWVANDLLPSNVLVGDPGVDAQGDHDDGKSGTRPCCCQKVWSTRSIGLQVAEEICHQRLDIEKAEKRTLGPTTKTNANGKQGKRRRGTVLSRRPLKNRDYYRLVPTIPVARWGWAVRAGITAI